MADNPNPVQDPNTPPADTPIDYKKDVADKPLEDILAEKQTELKETIDDKTDPNNPPVPPAETKTPEGEEGAEDKDKPKFVTEEIKPSETTEDKKKDAEALKDKLGVDKLKEEISEETAKKVVEFLGADTKNEDNKPPWEKEDRNPTYEEAINWAVKQAEPELVDRVKEAVKEDFAREAEEAERKAQEEKAAVEKLQEQRTEQWTSIWNDQFAELEAKGHIPKVNPEDKRVLKVEIGGVEKVLPVDPGKRARLQIFEDMQRVTAERTKAGKPALMSVIEAYFMHKTENKQPLGENAPINGANRGVGTGADSPLKYSEVVDTPIESILGDIIRQRSARS